MTAWFPYLTNFYMDYVKGHQDVKQLPPIFPIVLYNGDEPWTAPTSFEIDTQP